LAAELDRLKTEPVAPAELAKAKNQILRDFVLSRQSVQSLGEELGYAAVVLKDPNLLDAELERFLSVSPEDIQRVARQYFVPENATVLEVHPAATGLKPALAPGPSE
jgi:predicted Zn-dependent peptidase